MSALPKTDDQKQLEEEFGNLQVAIRPIKTPIESLVPITEEDVKTMQHIDEKYGIKLQGLYPDVILRFVQGYAHEQNRITETCKRLDHYFQIREDYNLDNILGAPLKNEEEYLNAWRCYVYGYDKQGHPIMYDEIASSTPEEIEKTFKDNMELIRQYRLRFLRRLDNVKRIQTQKHNKVIYKHVMVMDMSKFSRQHLYDKVRRIMREIIGDESNLWPNTLYKMYIINAPLAFRLIWKILSNFAHPITVAKIHILGTDFLQTMLEEIEQDQIPKTYGGKGKWEIKLGYAADIPKEKLDCHIHPEYTAYSSLAGFKTFKYVHNCVNKNHDNNNGNKSISSIDGHNINNNNNNN